jgi:hypothetical protein
MPDISHALQHLAHAKDELSKVDISKDNAQERHWNNFLNELELLWKKAERGCQDVKNKFQPFQGKYIKERRNDKLLSFLKNARDASQHEIQLLCALDILGVADGFATISSIDETTGETTNSKIQMLVMDLQLKSFHINNNTWIPPNLHKSKPLQNGKDPQEVGKLGIEYYESFLNDIKVKFDL